MGFGKYYSYMMRAHNFVDLSGRKIGRLSILSLNNDSAPKKLLWDCSCECGKLITTRAAYLLDGTKKSCGCLRSETSRKRVSTHGDSTSTEYRTWVKMRERCTGKCPPRVSRRYKDRGISIDPSWESYEAFLLDMGRKPTSRHTLERVDNDKGYCKSNCVWATRKTQARNTSTNCFIDALGLRFCVAEWAEKTGIPAATITARKNKLKWSDHDAVTKPLRCGGYR